MNVINFGEPLAHNIREDITEQLCGEGRTIAVLFREEQMVLDLAQPLAPQVKACVERATGSGIIIDAVIPPDFGPAAFLLAQELGGGRRMIWLRRRFYPYSLGGIE